MNMMSVCRRHVTLLELLIVMAILALVGGLVSIGVNRALIDQRFRTEVSLIVDQLRLAQDLMLILGTDVRLTFRTEKGDKNAEGIKYGLELETAISPNIEREVLRKHGALKTIKGVFYEDKESEGGQISVRFQSRGAVMSSGLMRLATTDSDNPPAGTLESYICLAGYPRHIFSENDGEKALAGCKASIASANDTQLTQDTFAKIPELFKQKNEQLGSGEVQNKSPEEEKPSAPKKRARR